MWWDKIKIIKTESYKSYPKNNTKDRTEVILDMPTEVYSEFRKQIEIPHVRNRRKSDSLKLASPGYKEKDGEK